MSPQTPERHARYLVLRNCRPRPSLPADAASSAARLAAATLAVLRRAAVALAATLPCLARWGGHSLPAVAGRIEEGVGAKSNPERAELNEHGMTVSDSDTAADGGSAPASGLPYPPPPTCGSCGAAVTQEGDSVADESGQSGSEGGCGRVGSGGDGEGKSERLAALFRAHFAASASRPRSAGGGGDGATMARALARAASGSVWDTSQPFAAALCKAWMPSLLAAVLLAILASTAAQLYIALDGRPAAGRRFRFTALEARGAPGLPAASTGLAAMGLTVNGCGDALNKLGAKLTFGPGAAQVTLTFPERVTANGWWFLTRAVSVSSAVEATAEAAPESAAGAAAEAAGDPVRFVLEQSDDTEDGDAACAARANSSVPSSVPSSVGAAAACGGMGNWTVIAGSSCTWTWAGGRRWGTALYPTALPAPALSAPSTPSSRTVPANGTASAAGLQGLERAEIFDLQAPRVWLAHRMVDNAILVALAVALLAAAALRCGQ